MFLKGFPSSTPGIHCTVVKCNGIYQEEPSAVESRMDTDKYRKTKNGLSVGEVECCLGGQISVHLGSEKTVLDR